MADNFRNFNGHVWFFSLIYNFVLVKHGGVFIWKIDENFYKKTNQNKILTWTETTY